jgi:hypothetical protein
MRGDYASDHAPLSEVYKSNATTTRHRKRCKTTNGVRAASRPYLSVALVARRGVFVTTGLLSAAFAPRTSAIGLAIHVVVSTSPSSSPVVSSFVSRTEEESEEMIDS